MTYLKRTKTFLPLAPLLLLVALTGCTTPLVSRTAVADMDSLCEKEAGITVYLPERWRPDVPAVEAPCPTGKGQCWVNPAGKYFASFRTATLKKTDEVHLSRDSLDWKTVEDGRLVATQTWFTVMVPSPLLSSHPTTITQCKHELFIRTLTSPPGNKK